MIVKSGTDFEEFSDVKVEFGVSEERGKTALADKDKNKNIKLMYSK